MDTVTAIQFHYDVQAMLAAMEDILAGNGQANALGYTQTLKQSPLTTTALNTAFATASRKTSKAVVQLSDEQRRITESILPGWTAENQGADRLLRTWLLLYYSPSDFMQYQRAIENLFLSASVNELAALYAALPLLPNAYAWRNRCAEGIRSNIGDVLEAIMYHNPYPAAQLQEAAWNQLVLKALFTGKDLNHIEGLDARANPALATVLHDFAHERWAAHRQAPPQLWRLTARFITEQTLPDFKRALDDPYKPTQQAAALALFNAPSKEGKALLDQYPALKQAASEGTIRWSYL